jgi:hypothetical protein
LAFLTQNKAKLFKKLIVTLAFEKKRQFNFLAENWQKSEKIVIITSTPDWANFSLLGDCYLWFGLVCKLLKQTNFYGFFFHGLRSVIILTKNGLGYILGDFFTNASGHPVLLFHSPEVNVEK